MTHLTIEYTSQETHRAILEANCIFRPDLNSDSGNT